MSNFLRKMTALSKRPSDFHKVATEPTRKMSTVDSLSTVDKIAPAPIFGLPVVKMSTVDKLSTVDSLSTVDNQHPTNKPPIVRVGREAVVMDGQVVSASACRSATLVQHGHTASEQLVYEALWKLAGQPDRKEDFRDIAIGYDRISGQIGGSKRNVQRLMESLQRKLAIDAIRDEISDIRQGKTYRIYSMGEILRRRREAGYTLVYRNRSAVELAKMSTVDSMTTVDSVAMDTVDSLSTVTVDSLSTPLGSKKEIKKEPSSSAVSVVVERVRPFFLIDDDAVKYILGQCRVTEPNCTLEEIAVFAEASARKIAGQGNVKSPVGLLISQVSKFFPSTELDTYRAQQALERAKREKAARAILDDPQATGEEKEWATKVLSE